MAYAGTARDLVTRLKYGGALGLVEVMAAQIAATAPEELTRGRTVVAVPLHRSRRRARGFDQAQRLAGAVARRLDLPTARCLVRRGPGSPQVGAGRRARLSPGRLEFAACGAAPDRVVLVDDVHTTGATLDACASALLRAGAVSVTCLAYARALPRSAGRCDKPRVPAYDPHPGSPPGTTCFRGQEGRRCGSRSRDATPL